MEEKKRSKNLRCGLCNKKLSLISMPCGKCNVVFCMEHRYPETHSCKKDVVDVVVLPEAVTFSKMQKI